MLDVSQLAGGSKGSSDGSSVENRSFGILHRMFPKAIQFGSQSFTDRDRSGADRLTRHGGHLNIIPVDILPLEPKEFAGAHSCIDGTDQQGAQGSAGADAGRKQSRLLIKRHHPRPFSLVSLRDQRITFTEGAANNPAFPFTDIEKPASQSKFTMNAGNASALSSDGRGLQPLTLVGLKIRMPDGAKGDVTEESNKGTGLSTNGITGTQTTNLSLVNVGWSDGVAIQIPSHYNLELGLRVVPSAGGQGFPVFQRLSEPISSLSLSRTRAPEGFTLSVRDPGDSSVDVSVLGDDLDLVLAGHLYRSLYFRGSSVAGKNNRETESNAEWNGKSNKIKGVEVLYRREQDSGVMQGLTSNQKVAGSSPAGCIQFFSKSSRNTKSQRGGKGGTYTAVYTYVVSAELTCKPFVGSSVRVSTS